MSWALCYTRITASSLQIVTLSSFLSTGYFAKLHVDNVGLILCPGIAANEVQAFSFLDGLLCPSKPQTLSNSNGFGKSGINHSARVFLQQKKDVYRLAITFSNLFQNRFLINLFHWKQQTLIAKSFSFSTVSFDFGLGSNTIPLFLGTTFRAGREVKPFILQILS